MLTSHLGDLVEAAEHVVECKHQVTGAQLLRERREVDNVRVQDAGGEHDTTGISETAAHCFNIQYALASTATPPDEVRRRLHASHRHQLKK